MKDAQIVLSLPSLKSFNHPAPRDSFNSSTAGVFPGLWLEGEALLRGDMKGVLATLRHGVDSPEHRAFAAQ